jgi:hypothetical protein
VKSWWKDRLLSSTLSVALGCPVPFSWCCEHFRCWGRNLCPSFTLSSAVQPFCCRPFLSFALWRLVKGVVIFFWPQCLVGSSCRRCDEPTRHFLRYHVMASPITLYHSLSPIPNTLYRCIRLYIKNQHGRVGRV